MINLLESCRVLDLTDEKGLLCGKILADLGADVIKVEPPTGDCSRNIGPFFQEDPDPEKSLYWFSYNLNKRSITLNLQNIDGQELFKKLVKTVDFVIESFPPGYMDNWGLGYSSLSTIKPGIVVTSITPYGQSGPYHDYKASDLDLVAMGGLLYITGFPDRPPVRISFPQSYLLAGCQAAAATMLAYYHRMNSGEGQHVDVSIQACVTWVLTNVIPLWELSRFNLKRQGSVLSGRGSGETVIRIVYPCKDGFVCYSVMGGRYGAKNNATLAKWIDEEGISDDFLRNFDWENYDMAYATVETQTRLEGYVERFFSKHTKKELYKGASKRSIALAPINSPIDILEDTQLKAREFWQQVEHPELGTTITYPGPFFKATGFTPGIRYRPPHIGEHNNEIYQELGISTGDLIRLKEYGAI